MFDDQSEHRLLAFIGKLAGYLIACLVGIWLLWQLRSVLPPFLVAFLLAVALAPVVDQLEKRGFPGGPRQPLSTCSSLGP